MSLHMMSIVDPTHEMDELIANVPTFTEYEAPALLDECFAPIAAAADHEADNVLIEDWLDTNFNEDELTPTPADVKIAHGAC
jgi:hypothetical protein